MASGVRIRGRLLKWGNSYGVRLRKKDAERLGLHPGEEVSLDLQRTQKIEDVLARFPLVDEGGSDVSVRHDEVLGRARLEEWKRTQKTVQGDKDDAGG